MFFKITDILKIIDLHIIQRRTLNARPQWYNVGLELDISPDTLDAIKSDNRDICADCYRAILKRWLKGRNPRPTLGALAEALGSPSVNMAHLAEQLPTMKESELYSYYCIYCCYSN